MIHRNQILELTDITKSYSGVTVLRNVDFTLHEEEIHCIVGENGAGKTTFIKILSGAILPDYGEIRFYGEKCTYTNPQTPIDMGISTIYQDVDLVDSLTVADNIFLNSEVAKLGWIENKKQNKTTEELLNSLGIKLYPNTLVEELSPAQKQMLQIAKALQRKAKVIIMDEPTASLGEEEAQVLLATTKKLAADGMGIIYISHYLEEVFELANTITVLKDGSMMGCFEASKVSNEQIISAMVGREASMFFQRESVAKGEESIRVQDLSRMPFVNDISFSVRKGEIFGIGGLVGSGKTELLRLIYGVDKKTKGQIFINGKETRIKSPRNAIAHGICMLGEDRKGDGLFLHRSVMENICIVKNERKVFLKLSEDKKRTDEIIRRLNLKTTSIHQDVERLSGGNQQKSIVARWLLSSCDIIVFDEPTKGVDIGARHEIYRLMVEIVKQGKTIIMVSSDMRNFYL